MGIKTSARLVLARGCVGEHAALLRAVLVVSGNLWNSWPCGWVTPSLFSGAFDIYPVCMSVYSFPPFIRISVILDQGPIYIIVTITKTLFPNKGHIWEGETAQIITGFQGSMIT